ncbi:MAG TPA: S41 family peptidase [Gemmatimonadaceae bacterium]|nr:S41 family peptidase [Gemmatimonadaceae bacterium]
MQQWREDLHALMAGLIRTHKNVYHSTSKATFDSVVADIDARIPRLGRNEIIAEFMRLTAMVGDGHTNIYPTRDPVIAFRTLPVSLYLFSDGWYVRAADAAHSDLVGARIIRIGGIGIDEAYARMKPYIGRDNEMGAKFWAGYLLAMPEMLNAAHLSPSIDSANFVVEKDGKQRSVWLRHSGAAPSTPGDTDASWIRRAGWIDARGQDALRDPLWLRHRPDSTIFWMQVLPGTRIGYVQINQVRNSDKESFESFSNRVLQLVDTAHLDKLIIDLRLNRGGNGGLRMTLVRGLLRRPGVNSSGRLYILTGRSTWSASQFILNDMNSFSEALFVGEPSGSKGNAYGDSRQIKLPNSGITARASIYYWQDWHPLDTRPWIGPDIAADLTFADYRANRDPVLTAAIEERIEPGIVEQLESILERNDSVAAASLFTAFRVDPRHKYVDGHELLDEVALHFYNNRQWLPAVSAFKLAATNYPDVLRAHSNLAAAYQQAGNKQGEMAALRDVLRLDPSNASALSRLKSLENAPQ